MKKIFLVSFMLIPVLSMAQINFTDLAIDQAIEVAKKENKMVFVDLSATWCGPCKTMKKTTFQDTKVGEFFNEKFVNLFIECDIDKSSAQIMKERYKFNAFPTLLFIDKDGALFHKIVGSMEAEEFLANVKDAMGGNNFTSYMNRYEAGENSPEFILELIGVAGNAYDRELVAKLTNQYLKEFPVEQLIEAKHWKMLSENVEDIDSEVAQIFMQNVDQFARAFGQSEVDTYLNLLWSHKAHSFADRATKEFDSKGYSTFIKRLEKSKFKETDRIKTQSALYNSEVIGNWSDYMKIVEKIVKNGVEIGSFCNFAFTFDKKCSDKMLRTKFAKTVQMELEKAIKGNAFDRYTELEKQYGKVYDYEAKLRAAIDNLNNN